jgi:hypothetical protein
MITDWNQFLLDGPIAGLILSGGAVVAAVYCVLWDWWYRASRSRRLHFLELQRKWSGSGLSALHPTARALVSRDIAAWRRRHLRMDRGALCLDFRCGCGYQRQAGAKRWIPISCAQHLSKVPGTFGNLVGTPRRIPLRAEPLKTDSDGGILIDADCARDILKRVKLHGWVRWRTWARRLFSRTAH